MGEARRKQEDAEAELAKLMAEVEGLKRGGDLSGDVVKLAELEAELKQRDISLSNKEAEIGRLDAQVAQLMHAKP